MPRVVVYYHDPVEVNPSTSWTGLCPQLRTVDLVHIRTATDPRVTRLFDYAYPDAVITVDEQPVLSIEQTQMNPSGHNIPQRFSCQVRAAELGVPSVLYYPEYSRRTFSDPNRRYLQVRVPLAQKRLSEIYNVPALSVFWPTDPETLLPITRQDAHQEIADLAGALISNAGNTMTLLRLPQVRRALANMGRVVSEYGGRYRENPSVRRLLPNGFPEARSEEGVSIDPPGVAQLLTTEEFIETLAQLSPIALWPDVRARLQTRQLTLVLKGTANRSKTDSEHPWPGYLALLDVLYLREEGGSSPTDRAANLVYRLPVDLSLFVPRMNRVPPPKATYIADAFADLILLDGGVVPGRPVRGHNTSATPVLVK